MSGNETASHDRGRDPVRARGAGRGIHLPIWACPISPQIARGTWNVITEDNVILNKDEGWAMLRRVGCVKVKIARHVSYHMTSLLISISTAVTITSSARGYRPHRCLSFYSVACAPPVVDNWLVIVRSLIAALWSIPKDLLPVGAMTFLPSPLQMPVYSEQNAQERVVIIDGGIIGLSTAYSFALALNEIGSSTRGNRSPIPKITIVESSDRLCPATSSQATGGLGDFGRGKNKAGTAGVATLSYNMHVDFAEKYNGRAVYRFSEQLVYRMRTKGFDSIPSPPDDWGSDVPPVSVPLSVLPR
ncbi:hypothetical protein EJ04DRAFT_550457 [Polyplosphaeria fusca]|uniref:FAD dependent oxidoreductase domain-containing protein n=1 Tax=Polyplosphaeria fusca TaxID=682080 RepID=A0A9P4V4H2_9PLEO|nr:hypothetical protein EJ04DRAFT_550457 [Polyplosphaeria fusca]